MIKQQYQAVVIGASAGGLHALLAILKQLPRNYALPVVVVQHIGEHMEPSLADYLDRCCDISVREADEKQFIEGSTVYIAPAGYHLLVEEDRTFSLSVDPRVQYARPSIDVLFDSAADAFGPNLVGVVLTGANADGSQGLKKIKTVGGMAVVQNPDTAEASEMPRKAMEITAVDYVMALEEIGQLLAGLNHWDKGNL